MNTTLGLIVRVLLRLKTYMGPRSFEHLALHDNFSRLHMLEKGTASVHLCI
jgi:hypothetical protein